MPRWLRPIAFAVVAAISSAAAASNQVKPVADVIRSSAALVQAGRHAQALAFIDAELIGRGSGVDRGQLLYQRGWVLSLMRRHDDALATLARARRLAPETPKRMLTVAYAEQRGERPVAAVRTILRMQKKFPGEVAKLDESWLYMLHRNLAGKDKSEARLELVSMLTTSGYRGGALVPGGASWVLRSAILGLVERNRLGEARALLPGAIDSALVRDMLIDRRYAALWPDIEDFAGAAAADAFVAENAALEAAHRAAPADLDILATYMLTLASLGREDDSIALSAPLVADLAKIEALGEDGFWLVDRHAAMLGALGRIDEGEALLARLLSLSFAKHPELISMAINRAGLLNNYDRPAQAIVAANWVAAKGADATTQYGWQLVRAALVCGHVALGEQAKATALIDDLVEHRKDNSGALARALLCTNRQDELEQLILERLEDPERRTDMLAALQDYGPSKYGSFRKLLDERLLAVRDRPSVRAAIARHGRILSFAAPRTYWGGF